VCEYGHIGRASHVLRVFRGCQKAIEEVITINELRNWMMELNNNSIDELLDDIKLYYSIELNLPIDD
jgi:hypothetical protein